MVGLLVAVDFRCGSGSWWRCTLIGYCGCDCGVLWVSFVCVCVLLGSLIGNGGLGCGFALCVFFAWQVCSMCVCFLLGRFAGGDDELRKRETRREREEQ